MERKDIVTRVTNMQTKNDLLLLLNDLLREELGDSCKYEFSLRQLGFFSNPNKDGRYHNFFISKKTGGNRTISAPIYKMGRMLHYVNIIFKVLYTPSEYAMGYCEGRNVVDNAVRHLGQNYIFNTDLEDLFPSIHQFRVQRRLGAAPFNFSDSISRVLAGLCCLRKEKPNGGYEYVLPQGAPTSPILANAVCDDLDRKLAGLSRRFGLHYTRYADDITFSSMHNVYQQDGEFLKEFEKIVKGQGFRINKEKTRLQKVGQHQEVTGLTVSSRVNTARKYVAEIRNILHIWERYGFEDAYASFYKHYVRSKGHIKKRIPLLENVLFGKLQYIKMVKGEKDPVYSALQARYNNLASPINIDRKRFDYLYSFPKEEFEEKIGREIEYLSSVEGKNYRKLNDTLPHVIIRAIISHPARTQLMSSGNPVDLYVVLASKEGKEPFWMLTDGDPLNGQRLDRELVSELLGVWQKDGIKAAISKYEETGNQISSQEFENMLLNNRGLSVNDKSRIKDLRHREMKMGEDKAKRFKSRGKQEHRPKDTAVFFALFNNPKGFKFLTHDFNPGEEINYEEFLGGVQERFDEETKNKKIPQSLYALMKAFLKGGSEPWVAYDGTRQKESYGCPSWREWIQKNPGEHVLTNGVFRETINLFRQTVRVASPALNDIIVKLADKYPNLEINTVNLERADFYTYVYYLTEGIDRILKDISQHCDDHHIGVRPQVNISFKRVYGDEFSLRIISITHCGSKAYNFDAAYQKYKEGGGAFNEIKSFFNGYCNWSVEAEWDGEPKRWDLLDDTGRAEVESLSVAPEGFTHILTYYYK